MDYFILVMLLLLGLLIRFLSGIFWRGADDERFKKHKRMLAWTAMFLALASNALYFFCGWFFAKYIGAA